MGQEIYEKDLGKIETLNLNDNLRVITNDGASKKLPFSDFPLASSTNQGLMSSTDKQNLDKFKPIELTLGPGEEVESPAQLVTAYHFFSMTSGLVAIVMPTALVESTILGSARFSGLLDSTNVVSIGRKVTNGKIYIKNNFSKEERLRIRQL